MKDSVFYEAISRCILANDWQKRSCDGCPLEKEYGCKIELLVEAWDRARNAEKTAPLIYSADDSDKIDAFCQKCKGHVYSGLPRPDTGEYEDLPEYCSYCGKKINWSTIKVK